MIRCLLRAKYLSGKRLTEQYSSVPNPCVYYQFVVGWFVYEILYKFRATDNVGKTLSVYISKYTQIIVMFCKFNKRIRSVVPPKELFLITAMSLTLSIRFHFYLFLLWRIKVFANLKINQHYLALAGI